LVVGRVQFLVDGEIRGPHFLVGWRSLSSSPHGLLQQGSLLYHNQVKRESAGKSFVTNYGTDTLLTSLYSIDQKEVTKGDTRP
jgi:hypothetical protein